MYFFRRWVLSIPTPAFPWVGNMPSLAWVLPGPDWDAVGRWMTLQQYRQVVTSSGEAGDGRQVPTGAAATHAHLASDMSPEDKMRNFSSPRIQHCPGGLLVPWSDTAQYSLGQTEVQESSGC